MIIVDRKESEEYSQNTISYLTYFGDYTTLWNRIHKIKIKIIPENKKFVELYIGFRSGTSKLLIKKFKLNINGKYAYKDKQYALEIIIFETVRKLANYVSGNANSLDLKVPAFSIKHIDQVLKDKILIMTPEERKTKNI
ncbi:MAG: hypothetical protein QXE05_06855 [Nitrososphaeria archaeon]